MANPFVISMKYVADASGATTAANEVIGDIGRVSQAAATAGSAPGLQSQLDGIFGIGLAGAGQTEEDIAAFGAQLDALRAKFNPLFALEQQHSARLAEMDQAFKVGAIDAEELAAAIAAENTAFEASTSALQLGAGALEGHAAASGHVSTEAMAAQHAVRSMAEQLALGVSPAQALTMQLGHLSFAASGEGGLVGAFKDVGGALAPLLTGPNLLAVGFIAAATAAASLWSAFIPEAKSASDALKEHQQELQNVIAGYKGAQQAAHDYLENEAQQPLGAALVDINQQLTDASKRSNDFRTSADQLGKALAGTFDEPDQLLGTYLSKFAQGKETIGELRTQLEGLKNTDFGSAFQNLNISIGPLHVGLKQLIADLADQAKGAADDARQLTALQAAQQSLVLTQSLGAGNIAKAFQGTFDALSDQKTNQQFAVSLAGVSAKSPDEKGEIAYRQKLLDLDGSDLTLQEKLTQANQARQLAVAQADQSLSDAARSRLLSLQQSIDAERTSLSTVGDSIAKTQALQFAQQNLAAAEAAAATSGTTVSAAERAEIEKLAAAYGDLAQQIAVKQLNSDQAFARDQLGRTSGEQAIAEQLRPIFGNDQSSAAAQYEASVIRTTNALSGLKETTEDVANDGVSVLTQDLEQGKGVLASFADAAATAFQDIANAFFKNGIDDIVSSLFGGATGGSGNWLSSIVGAFTGGGSSNGALAWAGLAHNASGTDYWRGGPTSINEAGDEVVNLPDGSQIIPHDVAMAQASGGAGFNFAPTSTLVFQGGNTDAATVQSMLDQRDQQWHAYLQQLLPTAVHGILSKPRRR